MKISGKYKIFNYFFIRSISFYPSLISLGFLCFAIVLLHFERGGLSFGLHDKLESVIITNNETARAVISAIISGLISLTVFSFTMVMVVLSQTGSNYSPRVIPGLITNRSHQVVLGFYLGTIIYSLMILINIGSEDMRRNVPGTAVLLDVIFAVVCLGLFVYFIHSISRSIQIGSIMDSVFNNTLKELKKEKNDQTASDRNVQAEKVLSQVKQWFPVESIESGFLQDFDGNQLAEIAKKHDIILQFISPPGFYVVKGIPFILMNMNSKGNEEICNEITKSFSFKQEELVELNYLNGFKHLSEIAVKSLSPAINDPGTAIRAINYFTDLFAERMLLSDTKVIYDKDRNPRIVLNRLSLRDMFSTYLSPLRNYGKSDLAIMKCLLEMSYNLAVISRKNNSVYFDDISHFLGSVVEEAAQHISNSSDRELLYSVLNKINNGKVFSRTFSLAQSPKYQQQ